MVEAVAELIDVNVFKESLRSKDRCTMLVRGLPVTANKMRMINSVGKKSESIVRLEYIF
jgi:hypothetical protein